MGVIYKLKPDIKSAIILEKRNNPQLSCRKLIKLIEEKYQVKVSKSSINSLVKEAGLSLPVGRRSTEKKIILPLAVAFQPTPVTPAPVKLDLAPLSEHIVIEHVTENKTNNVAGMGSIFLKAADALLGGSSLLTEVISKRLNKASENLLFKNEMLIYKSLASRAWLEAIEKKGSPSSDASSYAIDLQQVNEINYDLYRVISNITHPVRGYKFILSDKSEFYVDAQCHTIWSSASTPLDFNVTYWSAISYISRALQGDQVFTLAMPPLDDYPPEELFNFINALENRDKKLYSVALYADKLETLETVNVDPTKQHKFIFGLWPSQYNQSRIVRKIGESTTYNFKPFATPIYLAETEIVLTQRPVNKSVTLKGVAVKMNPNEKIRLVILTNIDDIAYGIERLAKIYLNSWPNMEEGLLDFNRKFEYQAYVSEINSFPVDKLLLRNGSVTDTQSLFDDYLKVLDLYVRRFFFPVSYQEHDFSSMNQSIYALPGTVEWSDNCLFIRLAMPSGFKYAKDLEYACRRLNERQQVVVDNQRVWLSCA